MTPSEPSLLVGRDGDVATLRFNRPGALNAIDVPMANAFLAAARALAADKQVRAVLLSGAGKGFMAGGDLAVLQADPLQGAADLIGPLHEALTVLAGMDAPLVAQVHGVAAGAGLMRAKRPVRDAHRPCYKTARPGRSGAPHMGSAQPCRGLSWAGPCA